MPLRNGNEVRCEKLIHRPVKDVFRALAEGRLFNNCGAALDHIHIDFRVGGHYQLLFQNGTAKLCGKFTEIVADRKIGFTWGDAGSDEGFPRSDVLIELFPEGGKDGGKTRVVIEHTGLKTTDEAEAHDFGWTTGLDDLTPELVEGRIRLMRGYAVSREKLFALVKGELREDLQEVVPGEKIVFFRGDAPTRVTILFGDEEGGESSLELIHELSPEPSVRPNRVGWERFLMTLEKAFG